MNNPQDWTEPTTTGTGTGREASANRLNKHVLNPGSHILHRRLGLYTLQPTKTQSDIVLTWTNSGLTASVYRTHGYVIADTTFEEIENELEVHYAGFCRDDAKKYTTYHLNANLHFNRNSYLRTSRPIETQMFQNYNLNVSSVPNQFSISDTTVSSFGISPYPVSISPDYYDPVQYQGYLGDCGALQFTTRDLRSYKVYEQVDAPSKTIQLTDDDTDITKGEFDAMAVTGKVKYEPGNTLPINNVMFYVPSFTCYPAGGNE